MQWGNMHNERIEVIGLLAGQFNMAKEVELTPWNSWFRSVQTPKWSSMSYNYRLAALSQLVASLRYNPEGSALASATGIAAVAGIISTLQNLLGIP
jgi:hypothetical protein